MGGVSINAVNVLSGKFAAAKLPEVCAPRHALINIFHREAGKRVIFVSAPAGYGKTVSTQLWLADSDFEPIWIGLDDYDNTPSIFYKLFCTGVLSAQPDNKAMADILRSPAFTSSPVEHTIRLLSEFIPNEKRYALVLDDMHLVTNEEIRKSGLLVQKRLPSSFITVILTRNEIAEEYKATVGKEGFFVITAQDLAFSAEEIQKYFNARGRFITMEEATEAHILTNGWAIGVNALTMSGKIELTKNGSEILEDYIKTQIWDKWDETLRDFMLRTAIVDIMSTELANRLSGRKDSKDFLEKLCAKNSFISHIGEDMYRYHPLFLEFLRNMQTQSDEALRNTLYKIVADYYLEKGDFFPARRYAFKSGNLEAIESSYALFNAEKSVSIDEYVNFYRNFFKEAMPEWVYHQHPYIYTTYVWYYFLIGDAPKMEYYMDMLYKQLPIIAQTYNQFMENSILITAIDHRLSFAKQIEQFNLFPAIANLSSQLQGTSISMQLPYAHRTLRDYYELTEEKVRAKLASSFGLLLKSQYYIVALELRSGLLYEQNLLKEALKIALQTKSAISGETRDELVFCSYIHLASIYYAMGLERMFEDVVGQANQYIEQNCSYYFHPNFMAFKTKMRLMDGDKTAAKMWLNNYFVTENETLELYKIFQHFTTARAYIVLSQTDKAMSYILKLKKLGADFHRPLDIAEASILQAVLEWALGNKKEAVHTLETVLITMQEFGFSRVFADEGASVLPALKKLALNLQKGNRQTPLKAKFLNEVIIAAYEQSKRHKGIAANIHSPQPVKLSKQQKYIVTLLSHGYKNAEIAKLTGLTIHTVKSHCAAAYAKLAVNNAMDAVLRAKELGLIDGD